MKLTTHIIVLFTSLWFDLSALVQLDSLSQPWVLDAKQIEIPGYPRAFNPSIVRWDDAILMSFRVHDPKSGVANGIGFVWLDDDMQLISAPQVLDLTLTHPFDFSWAQDPRLLVVGNDLFMVFNDLVQLLSSGEKRRMFICRLSIIDKKIVAESPQLLLDFEGQIDTKNEKNWVPFNYGGNLLLAYSLLPHRIFLPICSTCRCETFMSTTAALRWQWGILRGGTPALIEGDEYLAFFHSTKGMATVESGGERMAHYLMGAYTFSAEPPFEIRRISPEPIVHPTFYHAPYYKTWKPLKAIFPAGFISDGTFVWVAYGRQDNEVWIVKMDKQALLQSLVPVGTTQ